MGCMNKTPLQKGGRGKRDSSAMSMRKCLTPLPLESCFKHVRSVYVPINDMSRSANESTRLLVTALARTEKVNEQSN